MFPALSCEKTKVGVFDRPQTRWLLQDKWFLETMYATKKETWNAFAAVVSDFLRNRKSSNYK